MTSIPFKHVYTTTRSVLEGTYPSPASGREVSLLDWTTPAADTTNVAVTASDIFGADSFMPDITASTLHNMCSLADSIPFQITVVVLLAFYFMLVLRYGSEIIRTLSLIFTRSNNYDRNADNNNSSAEVLTIVYFCGLLSLSIASIRIPEVFGFNILTEIIPCSFTWTAVFAVAVILFLLFTIQKFLMLLIGRLTFTTDFLRIINSRRRAFFTSLTVFGTPAALLLALSSGIWAQIFAWIFICILIVHIASYVAKSFLLFVEQKVSILFWILYLCTVELTPFAILIAFAGKTW